MTVEQPGLTALQVDVARTFFTLPESAGFLLAGGAALVVQRLSVRYTADLDLFTSPGRGAVIAAADALASELSTTGCSVDRDRTTETFARILVARGDEFTAVDLAVDATPGRPPLMSMAGPTLDPEDLAGRKLLALFSRALARDFVDVFALAQRYGTDRLIALAAEMDAGFDRLVLADMLQSVRRLEDSTMEVEDPAAVKAFALDWAARLREGG